jgi:hypothetical protein
MGNPYDYAMPGNPQPGWPSAQQYPQQPQSQPQLQPQPQQTYGAPNGHRAANNKGFFGSLFDFTFDNFIAPKLVRFLFVLSMIGLSISTIVMMIAGLATLTQDGSAKLVGLLLIVLAPLAWFVGLIVIRLYLELAIVMFKISDDLKDIRDNNRTSSH